MKFLVNREQFKTKKKLDGNNYLVAYDVPIAKTGIQYYTLAEIGVANSSQQVPVYRDIKTFEDDRLVESFDGMLVVFCHPDDGEVTSDNFRDYVVGTISGTYEKNGLLYAKKITIIDEKAIEFILSKKNNQLSIGFRAQVERKPGKFNGIKFDYVEKVIHGNHLALCTKGKAGPFFAINSTKIGGKMTEYDGEVMENTVVQTPLQNETYDIARLIDEAVEKKMSAIRPYLKDVDLGGFERKEEIAEEHLKKEHGMGDEEFKEPVEPEEIDAKERDKALINAYKTRTKNLENQVRDLLEENVSLQGRIDQYTTMMKDLTEKLKSRPIINAIHGPQIEAVDLSRLYAK